MIQHSGAVALDDHIVSDSGRAVDQDIDLLVNFDPDVTACEVPPEARAGEEAPGLLVEADAHDVEAARDHAGCLFAKGCEEVFFQAPLEECADIRYFGALQT